MTGALPYWRVVDRSPGRVTIAVTDDDLAEIYLTLVASVLGTPAMDTMIRKVVARRHENRAAAQDGGA